MPHTPAGAYLSVRRGRRWSSVQVDRISITDATEQQAATVRELALATAYYCATHGHRGGLSLAGEVLWYLTVPAVDLEDALAALLALERDEHEPARALAARYRAPRRRLYADAVREAAPWPPTTMPKRETLQ